MIPVIFHPDVKDEFISTIAFYNNQSYGLGGEFLTEIENCSIVSKNPPNDGKY